MNDASPVSLAVSTCPGDEASDRSSQAAEFLFRAIVSILCLPIYTIGESFLVYESAYLLLYHPPCTITAECRHILTQA